MENQAVVDPKKQEILNNLELVNSLSGLCESIGNSSLGYNQNPYAPQISSTNTLFFNLRWYLISNLRQLLSQLYVEHGIVQTLVDQPVDDAFRAGFTLKTSQLDANDIEQLQIYEQRNRVIERLMQAMKWARLYGGGAVLIITDQDPKTPLNLAAIGPNTPLDFRAVDMWELYYTYNNTTPDLHEGESLDSIGGDTYDYYGQPVHFTRVYRIEGKEAPSFIRPRLRGWGMSELERLVRSLNQYLKNQDVIFELLDEAKIDIYKIKGLNSALMSADGTNSIARRITMANLLKNYQAALTMDKEDDYEQKQISFAGLGEILLQIRQGIAADVKMPMTKLFGISAAGFSSGEDDIENYNSMLEGEIRNKAKFKVIDLLQICCQKLFGTTIDDLQVEFNPLRILNAKEEEEVKDSQFNRVMSGYSSGLVDAKSAKQSINLDSLIGVELEENDEVNEPLGDDDEFKVAGQAKGSPGKQAPKEA